MSEAETLRQKIKEKIAAIESEIQACKQILRGKADGKERVLPTSQVCEVDPFDEWSMPKMLV